MTRPKKGQDPCFGRLREQEKSHQKTIVEQRKAGDKARKEERHVWRAVILALIACIVTLVKLSLG